MNLTQEQINSFQSTIYNYYKTNSRFFSWRNTTNPYHIFVSEVMLQQTQTKRVEKKYEEFISIFPDFEHLATAPLFSLLRTWQGLGYNRRALNMQKSAQLIIEKHHSTLPSTREELLSLPGIGTATAGSLAAFAFNAPTVFVETNIRVVFIHFFLTDKTNISDAEILSLVEQTIDKNNPRIWYYALMDYGVKLKAQGINPINQSKHYKKQSKFQGSDRQIRGEILKTIVKHKQITQDLLINIISDRLNTNQERVSTILERLIKEQLVRHKGLFLSI